MYPASALLHASQPSISVSQHTWAGFLVPPNSSLRPFFGTPQGPSPVHCSVPLNFSLAALATQPASVTQIVVQGRFFGAPWRPPPASCSVLLNFGLAVRAGVSLFSFPLKSSPRPFLGHPWGPASALLLAPQIWYASACGHRPNSRFPEYLCTKGLLAGGNSIANEKPNTVALNNYRHLLKYIHDINRSAHFVVFGLPPRNFDVHKVDIMTFNKLLQSLPNHMASIVTVMQTLDTFVKKKEVTWSDFDPSVEISVAAPYKK